MEQQQQRENRKCQYSVENVYSRSQQIAGLAKEMMKKKMGTVLKQQQQIPTKGKKVDQQAEVQDEDAEDEVHQIGQTKSETAKSSFILYTLVYC